MKLFKEYIIENQNNPYDWDLNYGKKFKFIHLPKTKKVISLVTPVNRSLWNRDSISDDLLSKFKKSWNPHTLDIHKQYQIETGKYASADDFLPGGKLEKWSSMLRKK